jgi:hypothetical protein
MVLGVVASRFFIEYAFYFLSCAARGAKNAYFRAFEMESDFHLVQTSTALSS